MLLFTSHITARLSYIVGFFSKELFDTPIRITTDREEFLSAAGPRINYSSEPDDSAFSFTPAPLLFETGITPQAIECFEYKGYKAFFATNTIAPDPTSPSPAGFPFDIFAASFYLLSRYEEYLPHEKDEYGRYAYKNSLAWKEGFLDIPLINYWLLEFKLALQRRYPDIVFRYPAFKFIPTYDIDLAYSYLFKGLSRNFGGGLKQLLTGQWRGLSERIAVLGGRRPDPYDAYEWLDSLHLYCRMKPYYFFLVASRHKGVDRNIPPAGPGLRELVAYHAAGYRLGIHPSWSSGDKDRLLGEEIEWMEQVTDKNITRSRQHYIRFTLPHTYRRLLFYGIDQEFSMGYGSINGFRASVASSFYWYDLEREEETTMRIFPFCFMDANARYEQGLTPSQAMTELMHYYHHIRKVNGLMVTIWHNNFLGIDPAFAGWREVYEVFLKEEVFWDN